MNNHESLPEPLPQNAFCTENSTADNRFISTTVLQKKQQECSKPFLALFEWQITDETNLLLYGGIYSHLMERDNRNIFMYEFTTTLQTIVKKNYSAQNIVSL